MKSTRPAPSTSPTPPARSGATARFFLALVLVALSAAAFAVAFRLALAFALRRASGADDVVSAFSEAPIWVRLIFPALGGLVAGMVGFWLRRLPTSQGVGDVMEAVVLGRARLSMRVTLAKSFASFCAIVTGGSIGREGPLVQVGAAAGKFVGSVFGVPSRSRRALIAAGTAAGFAAAYNTPFAAVLFVLEVVLGIVALDTVLPVLAATAIATAFTRAVVGPGPVYGQRAFALRAPTELIAFAGLGLVAALVAQGFMRLLNLGERWFRRPALPMPWRPALGGLGAGALVALIPEVAGNGYEPLNALLDGRLGAELVFGLLIAKCIATTFSVSSGSPGGVFTPTMLVGGSVGFLYFWFWGHVLHVSLGQAGGYALVGVAAATAATTHAPLMASVMAFELSGDYAVVLPLLLATSIATAVSRAFRSDSVYTSELRRRGVRWELTLEGRRLIEEPQQNPSLRPPPVSSRPKL